MLLVPLGIFLGDDILAGEQAMLDGVLRHDGLADGSLGPGGFGGVTTIGGDLGFTGHEMTLRHKVIDDLPVTIHYCVVCTAYMLRIFLSREFPESRRLFWRSPTDDCKSFSHMRVQASRATAGETRILKPRWTRRARRTARREFHEFSQCGLAALGRNQKAHSRKDTRTRRRLMRESRTNSVALWLHVKTKCLSFQELTLLSIQNLRKKTRFEQIVVQIRGQQRSTGGLATHLRP
jgi:hypothetical protein